MEEEKLYRMQFSAEGNGDDILAVFLSIFDLIHEDEWRGRNIAIELDFDGPKYNCHVSKPTQKGEK